MTTASEFFSAWPEWAEHMASLTPDQDAVLDFLCGSNADGFHGLEKWLGTANTRDLDDGVNRLFPFVYEKVRELDPEHPLLPFFRGNSRKTFYANNLLFRRAATKIAELQAQRIPVLILKGAALIQSHAYRTGLRPMADIDFLIPTDAVGRALEILTPLRFDSLEVESLRDFQHGHTILDEFGFEYDLHWHILPQCCGRAERNEPFWLAAEPTSFHGVDVFCLSPTDSLFVVCVHGIQWNPVPPIRWIPDSLALLRSNSDRIEWPRLVRQAAETETTLLLFIALRYLRTRFQAPIPGSVLTALGNNDVSALEAASLPLAMVPWASRVSWTHTEPVLREQVRLHAVRYPGRPIIALFPWDSWTQEHSRVCESIGAVPIVRAKGLPATWEPIVRKYFEKNAASIIPSIRAYFAKHPLDNISFSIRLTGPDFGEWRVVVQTEPPTTGDLEQWSPRLDVKEIHNTPFDQIPRDAIQIEVGRFSVTRPGTIALTDANNRLATYNQMIGKVPKRVQ